MSGQSLTHAGKTRCSATPAKNSALNSRASRLAVNEPGDKFEREADRVAAAVVSGGQSVRRLPFSFAAVPVVQRDDGQSGQSGQGKKPKSEEEKYKEAAKKVGEAFLETAPGKEITKKAEELGDAFISTLPGKVITGAAITGAVAALAATHKELPIGIPEIPLDRIKPGLKMKITYEGPVDKPTKVMATFSFKFGGEGKGGKKPPTEREEFRAETARMAKEQREFREGLKTPEEKADEQRRMDAYLKSRLLDPTKLTPKTSPLSFGAAGQQFDIKQPSLSSDKPAIGGPFAPPELKLTGEEDKKVEPAGGEKKKEEGEVMRKEAGDTDVGSASLVARDVHAAQSSGQPLDASTLAFMQSRFGFDFSHVRIHTDGQAAASAREVNALAYTFGSDIVFAGGQYSPHTTEGRRLIAHELAHVVQQSGGGTGLTADPAPVTLRRKESAAAPEPDPVQKALKGDDDDVRDLTNNPKWKEIKLTAEQAAQLIIHLLDGATLNPDERAGLAILTKQKDVKLLDDSLLALDKHGRFPQLLDDYHGAQYKELLRLLRANVENKAVKAAFLDAFIDMWSWFVWYHEEEAIVVLLERTTKQDQTDLLTKKDRTQELRDTIGDEMLSKRFEIIVVEVNKQHGAQLEGELVGTQLSAIFRVKATASVKKGQRTQAEVDELLRDAARDLASELADYRKRLDAAVKDPKRDSGDIKKINREFEKRLKDLIEQKKAEFDMELEYNIEFNKLLGKAFGREWRPKELQQFSKEILSKIPYDILHANPDLEAIARAEADPDRPGLAGQASESEKRIKLFSDLTLDTTAHEVGHFIHYDDSDLYEAFQKISEWLEFTTADMATQGHDAYVQDQKDRDRLLKQMDADYATAQTDKNFQGSAYEYKGYMYRFARGEGAGTYRRFKKGSCFITPYAGTKPTDDFAESFAHYIDAPAKLQDTCPEKYEFMHVRVFVEYRLKKQKERMLTQFDDEVSQGLATSSDSGSDFAAAVEDKFVIALRAELEQKLDEQRAAKIDEADKAKGKKPVPIPMDAQGEKLAQPYLGKLRAFLSAAKPVVSRADKFSSAVLGVSSGLTTVVQDAFKAITSHLESLFQDQLMALLDPLAQRAVNGAAVEVTAWPELDKLAETYDKALGVVQPYLPLYRNSMGLQMRYVTLEAELLGSVPTTDKRESVRQYMVNQRDTTLNPQIEQWQKDTLARIRNGTPYDPAQVKNPAEMWKQFEKDARAFAQKAARVKRRAASAAEPTGDVEAVQGGLQSPDQPLDGETRGFMESRFGFDFSQVRIHANAQASASAKALDAKAFTAGNDVVFGENEYAPETPQGQELLAHELTHVVQQEGATPAIDSKGKDDKARRTPPPPSFEQIDLPQTEAVNTASEGAADAIAPVATAPESVSSESAQAPSAEPPMGEGGERAVAAAPMNKATASPLVVPPSHPSEQEAERISRAVTSPDAMRWPVHAPAMQRLRNGHAQRKPDAKPDKPVGKDIAFIMGVDKNPRKNPFYREAAKYFKANLPDATLVNDKDHRSLESVFDYLRDKGERVANLYIVSHANEDGTLSFKLRNSDKNSDPHVQYGELNAALSDEATLFNLPKDIIDEDTRIYIKGCNIGRSTRMLDALDKAFGGEGKVIAPTHKQVYGTKSVGKGKDRKVENYEALKVYFIEYKGNQNISATDQQAAFTEKYPELSAEQWKKWVPVNKKGKGGASRQPISISYTYKYNIKQKTKETKRMAEEEALPKAIEWGETNIGRADMFEWRVASSTKTGYGWFVTCVAEKTNYVVDKILVDEAGKRLTPAGADAKYFGTSTFGDDAKKAAQVDTDGNESDTAALIAELAAIDKALADLTEGQEGDERLARREELQAQLKQRKAFVDVHVKKTEDWLGADEVYVRMGGFRSKTKKLNDGQSHRFDVPLTHLMPFDQPATVEVFDEDLGWFFDRDDLIVKMLWQPPFAETTNGESFDEADYRVKAHV